MRAAWHALFAPLPEDAVVRREPVLGAELAGKPESAAIAGWESVTVEYVHENVGGRIQPNGSFLGSRWRSVAVEVPGNEEPQTKETTHSEPTDEDVAGLMRVVRELLSRA